MHTLSLSSNLIALFSLAGLSTAICPGYNYAFINGFYNPTIQSWIVVDVDCFPQAYCPILDYPCDCPFLGCETALGFVDNVEVNGFWCVISRWRFEFLY